MSEDGKKGGKIGGKKQYELGIGVHGRSKEQMSEDGRKAGKRSHELGVGAHARTKEEQIKSQKWKCTITGYVCNSGGLSCYQKKRGIDTSNRIRIQ
jgi:hypothetical protein